MKIGLTLSGGGIRGIAHLGVAKALMEAGIKFTIISGTSAGAIVGAFLANGYQPDFILQTFKETHLFKYIKPTIKGFGLLTMQNTRPLYKQYLPDTFEELKIPLVVSAVDFGIAQLTYFSTGELISAIQASSCIPAVFKPIEFNGKIYVDGGILDNFPVEIIKDECNFIIGSCCNNLPEIKSVNGIKHMVERSVNIGINSRTEAKKRLCNVVIEPKDLGATSLFHVRKTDEIFKTGYEEALKVLDSNEDLQSLIRSIKEVEIEK
ncbi:patatin-like phospholipase family protein [Solitalea koreensis]|uniref:NTE family protein n=1 Tax=Solitalea koreensis TaxID=543615 RepID=A0A521AT64_9SPHI|nr:patatin-like phospholipase family protein [Solitalea koreensis]SMO37996.1 NTE family protein [Solitalea koreensis]